VILLAALVFSGAAGEQPLSLSSAVADFHSWHKVNAEPVMISYYVDGLCRSATAPELVKSKANPHRNRYITVWVNPKGRSAMGDGSVFPAGSVIIKEKRDGVSGPVVLSTVMVKRAKGYNPPCGDWEFAVLDASGRRILDDGKLDSCMKCHTDKSKLDYTYRTYVDKTKTTAW
jgi:hypothetical protein